MGHPSSHNGIGDLEIGCNSVAMSGSEIDAIPSHDLANSLSGVKVLYRVIPRYAVVGRHGQCYGTRR